MSYIIYKDIKSSDIGVIIERLPPIIKPPMKNNLSSIDGSSAIKIETLGYEGYIKSIPIGFNNEDIDYVTEWLNGSGSLVLSDEPDKYYDATVLEQIDYTRALRFRKAEIPFFVQPIKHAVYEFETTETNLFNSGNIDCYPLMTITGSGSVGVKVNGVLICTVTINGYITLDGEIQEAYKDTLANLQNRSMSGNFPVFKPGANKIEFTGTVTNVKTLVRSRWV